MFEIVTHGENHMTTSWKHTLCNKSLASKKHVSSELYTHIWEALLILAQCSLVLEIFKYFIIITNVKIWPFFWIFCFMMMQKVQKTFVKKKKSIQTCYPKQKENKCERISSFHRTDILTCNHSSQRQKIIYNTTYKT